MDLDPEEEILSSVLVWIRLPPLLLNLWGAGTIGNKIERFVDKAEIRTGLFICA